ncbi:chitin-binding protein [Pseudoalteromonas sp. YIC-827]|uniref:Chitin-binding protein n=1 Tax=Pseudoalteromonas qingdaonensis TaxID=3131913 RepID=A0ABU9MXF7_9GAMM
MQLAEHTDIYSNVSEALPAASWLSVGTLSSHTQLFRGDIVEVEVYDHQGLVQGLSFKLYIKSDQQGEPQNWSREVAHYINTHIPLMQAGKFTEHGLITAYRGNEIFACSDSGICEVVINYNCVAKQQHRGQHNNQGYDHIFPVDHELYCAGDRVLHLATGKVYRCKPWPYTELCRLGGNNREQYEPGVGLNWRTAWQEIES